MMFPFKCTQYSVLALILLCSSSIFPGFTAAQQNTYHTSQQHFRVPFQINPNGRKLIEIQIFQSTDLGKSWAKLATLPPQSKHFVFKTNRDQQVWFAIKSLDRDQRIFPAGPTRPDVRIVIDSRKPLLETSSQADAAGRIVTSISANDPFINPSSLKIEFQSGRNGQWKNAGVISKKKPQSQVFFDRIAWWPKEASGRLLVKVSIADFAGNRSEVFKEVQISGPSQLNLQVARQVSNTHHRPSNHPTSAIPFQPASSPTNARQESADLYTTHPNRSPISKSTMSGQPQSIAWQSESVSSPTKTFAATTETSKPQTPTQNFSTNGNEVVAVGSTHPSPPSQNQGNSTSQLASRTSKKPFKSVSTNSMANLLQSARPTNTNRFLLSYDVDAIAPNEIKEVGLWATLDGGQSWKKWGTDPDHQSPMPVDVPSEGIYGFRVVVSSVDGVNSRVPRSGEDADMWVRYDQTKPQAQITSAPYGRGEHAGKLMINWQASDEQLILRPITLSWSSRPEGPWTTIANDLRNDGGFVWKVPQSVPDEIYLQLKVVDAAGNVAIDQPRQSINVANLVPRGRINGLQPLRPRQVSPPADSSDQERQPVHQTKPIGKQAVFESSDR